MRSAVVLVMLSFFVAQVVGCGSLEYREAAAHFNENTLLENGEPYLGKKIVVKGTVSKHEITDPENSKVYLGHSICCNFGDLQKMAEN